MLILISAALAAAAPAAPSQAPDPHAAHKAMSAQTSHEGHSGGMKDCCCDDMAKHEGHGSDGKASESQPSR